MAIIDNRTSRGWLLPHPDNKIKDDVVRLIAALEAADGDVTDILLALGGKAAIEHVHTIGNVTGLQDALDEKRDLTEPYAFDDLSDVNATGAADGQVVIRQAGTWIPINLQVGNITNLETLLNLKAPLADPAFTGNPTVPTQLAADNSTRAANTAFVKAALAALVGAVPGTLDTLDELAAALGDDPNFATTMATALGDRVAYSAQTKTSPQKAQARTNIGAPDATLVALLAGAVFTGTVTAPGFQVVDSTYSMYIAGANPILLMDANDYFTFTRASNTLGWLIAGVPVFTIGPTGALYTSQMGDVATYIGNVAASWAASATAHVDAHQGVGMYTVAKTVAAGNVSHGATTPGSNLTVCAFDGTQAIGAVPGTWRCCSSVSNSVIVGLWQRVS